MLTTMTMMSCRTDFYHPTLVARFARACADKVQKRPVSTLAVNFTVDYYDDHDYDDDDGDGDDNASGLKGIGLYASEPKQK